MGEATLLMSGWGTKFFDYDNDGWKDIFVAQIRLVSASGRTQYQVVSTAPSYQSANDKRVHFGLGTERAIKQIEIRWPSGTVQRLSDVKANQVLKITESVSLKTQ